MLVLSLELLEEALSKEVDAEVVTTAPEEFDDGFFRKFLKVLGATSLDELTDETDDELVKMLEEGEKLFSKLHLNDDTYSGIFRRLSECHSAVFSKRRVL